MQQESLSLARVQNHNAGKVIFGDFESGCEVLLRADIEPGEVEGNTS
jgi:hypothetical protein